MQETLFRCNFKCWKNGEFKTIKVTYLTLLYDPDLNWIVAKQGKRVRSSYKVSNIMDVRLATWGAFLHHITVHVWVTDDDGNRFKFEYDGGESAKVFERIKSLAERHSSYYREIPRVVAMLNRSERVSLQEVSDSLPEGARRWGIPEARELVEHLVEVGDAAGKIEGGWFVRDGLSPSDGT